MNGRKELMELLRKGEAEIRQAEKNSGVSLRKLRRLGLLYLFMIASATSAVVNIVLGTPFNILSAVALVLLVLAYRSCYSFLNSSQKVAFFVGSSSGYVECARVASKAVGDYQQWLELEAKTAMDNRQDAFYEALKKSREMLGQNE